jgi:hypothetical protein
MPLEEENWSASLFRIYWWEELGRRKPMPHTDKDRWAFVLPFLLQIMNTCVEYRSKKKKF